MTLILTLLPYIAVRIIRMHILHVVNMRLIIGRDRPEKKNFKVEVGNTRKEPK